MVHRARYFRPKWLFDRKISQEFSENLFEDFKKKYSKIKKNQHIFWKKCFSKFLKNTFSKKYVFFLIFGYFFGNLQISFQIFQNLIFSKYSRISKKFLRLQNRLGRKYRARWTTKIENFRKTFYFCTNMCLKLYCVKF